MKRKAPESATDALGALGDIVTSDQTQLTSDPELARVHKRTIAMLLGAAVQRMKVGPVTMKAVIGASYSFSLPTGTKIKASDLSKAMAKLIEEKLTFTRELVPRADVVAYFEAQQAEHTLAYARACMDAHIACFACDLGGGSADRLLALDHGPLAAHAGCISPSHFRIDDLGGSSFRLQYAVPSATADSAAAFALHPTDEPILLGAYADRQAWSASLGLRSTTEVGQAICDSRSKQLVQLSEALHDRNIVEIANRIAGVAIPPSDRPRLVLIAGPTSSGKTTFAKRLCVALEALGANPAVVSVDSYYKGWPDIDPRGAKHVDWEALASLNLTQLNDHLLSLLAGEEASAGLCWWWCWWWWSWWWWWWWPLLLLLPPPPPKFSSRPTPLPSQPPPAPPRRSVFRSTT